MRITTWRQDLQRHNVDTQQLIGDCLDAYAIAKETIAYCLQEGGELSDRGLVVALLNCSDVCRTTSEFVAFEAALQASSCNFCAIVCDHTAKQCGRFPDDEQLSACIEAMRNCAQSCRDFASADLENGSERFGYP